ncbi:hypothetical protein [Pontibacter roseus]|uniref:hypothetical protein n=1 Tax=Pontibacter roseus TaxID=336989 RepID=UPI00037131AF|nr:hypothetical protein [Pontibacter roseus]
MKNFSKKSTSILAAVAMLFSFTACEQNEVTPDASMSAQGVAEAHKTKSMNLNQTYTVELMELNNSGVSGMATIELTGDMVDVHLQAAGLTPNMEHMQHIHGFTDSNKNAVCPPMSADTDGDGLISLVEGVPYYGPVLLALTPYPTADAAGSVNFMRDYGISKVVRPLQNNVIVLHGMYVDGVYDATIPVACGQLKVMNRGN